MAAPYAGMVMDARTGEVYYSENADTQLHPASLTKMMTLYIAFEAVENGELSMDTLVTITRNAAAEPPSKLGLRSGQKIKLRYLVRAAAVKSANDAATAIGEAIEGTEAAFARRMNRTAKAMGMTRTNFKNAHGLTESGHLSTARDMSILGRHVLYDYPEYYNLFSRITADAGMRKVSHTNRRLLQSYSGADGIKTGYTRAAGFNLVASAERGGERVIATVFGGRSTATRNAQVEKLLTLGFNKAPSRVAFNAPNRPPYMGKAGDVMIAKTSDPAPGLRAKSIRVAAGAVTRSLRPQTRPGSEPAPLLVAEVGADIEAVVKEAQAQALALAAAAESDVAPAPEEIEEMPQVAALDTDSIVEAVIAASEGAPEASVTPRKRPEEVVLASLGGTETAEVAAAPAGEPVPAEREVVSRISTSGGRHWGINVGKYPSRYSAERMLLKTALQEMATLNGSLRKVINRGNGYDANFMGMSQDTAKLACQRLEAREVSCSTIGPS
ncbi:D-alanyl-D-alanine carboxypeptidase [Roseivivax sp. GX 12232]|uniref:D-alanyl-D-alanine carboxypeptidase family protein n=1 Tax=Roseivivax sp. GX 12232 TaxID=2900547 RepID=UPI001E53C3C3|nr:D-alanyl-D-alanine carboxypeptidase family protein [Roseivivax sp. GX 12232]MCE0507068.1 D-alanyl-D-alanine carboxypeptidase [Roseivivax sp. GX 12232]